MVTVSYQCQTRQLAIIFLNDREWRKVDPRVLGKKNPFAQSYPSKKKFEEEFSVFEYKRALRYAYWHLARRSMRTRQMEEVLTSRLLSKKTIDRVVALCVQRGFLDDAEWVNQFIARQNGLGFGPKRIRWKLAQKGFPEHSLSSSQQEMIDQRDPSEVIRSYLEKKWGQADLACPKTRKKAVNFLLRKGFSYENVLHEILHR